jgi:lysozyme family protein
MVAIAALKAANAKRWSEAKPTRNLISIAKSLVAAKPRYLAVQNRTNVPWFFVAVVHERESSQSWKDSLAQGDPWNKVSVNVPAGRGPFDSWEDAAIDALMRCSPFAGRNRDWSIGGLLTEFETYNGLGYAMRDLPSPYVWAGTDQYTRGKFGSDHRYNPELIDKQPGCAALLMAMMTIDKTIVIGEPAVIAAPEAAAAVPAKPSIIAALSSYFRNIGT